MVISSGRARWRRTRSSQSAQPIPSDNQVGRELRFSYLIPDEVPLDAKELPDEGKFLSQHLGVMDSTAVTLCRENGMPIRVFKMMPGNIRAVAKGEDVGTVVGAD